MSVESQPVTPTQHRIIIVAGHDDPLDCLVEYLRQQINQPSNLTHCTVIVPPVAPHSHIRNHLLTGIGSPALLGPEICSLQQWLARSAPLSVPVMPTRTSELMLAEALQQHPELVGDNNLWALTDSLLTFFEQLSAWHVTLPQDLDDFTDLLARGYHYLSAPAAPLNQEARIVHTLWQAFTKQQAGEGYTDEHTLHALRLHASLQRIPDGTQLILLCPLQLTPVEVTWARTLLDCGRLTIIVHGELPTTNTTPSHPDSPLAQLLDTLGTAHTHYQRTVPNHYYQFLNTTFAPHVYRDPAQAITPAAPSLLQRAQGFAADCPRSPLQDRITVYKGDNAEQEARAVDIQVRRWLQDGKHNIGIICEDRRLARRLRALLERAGITLQDRSGWALSTTRAAATLEAMLQTAEEDYAHLPLLDLLKSPYFVLEQSPGLSLATVFQLEQDIIRRENIARGLQRYRQHIQFRQRRAAQHTDQDAPLLKLLDLVESLCAPLTPFLTGRHPPARILSAMLCGLETSGMLQRLDNDPAGARLIEEIRLLQRSLIGRSLDMSWQEFRAWFGRALEKAHFIIGADPSPVQLLTLEQSPLARFDAVIITSTDLTHLPGKVPPTPFFNDAVRRELGLPTSAVVHSHRLHHFLTLLSQATRLLMTWHQDSNSDDALPSPWLELIQTFHDLAYKTSLLDHELRRLVLRHDSQICDRQAALPRPSLRPRPVPVANELPDDMTASMYQNLVNCPYRFFAAHILKLRAPDRVREIMERADFGSRIHQVLQQFHSGPVSAVTADRTQLLQRLNAISRAVFSSDIEDNPEHRNWLNHWLECTPHYVDWLLDCLADSAITKIESEISMIQTGDDSCGTLRGKIDRIDHTADGITIIDYKTGQLPSMPDIIAGENVQLPYYALLAGQPRCQTVYLGLLQRDKHGQPVISEQRLDIATTSTLALQHFDRLSRLRSALNSGAGMPAWGDEATCARCDMQGVCRKQSWHDHGVPLPMMSDSIMAGE
ncbi:MAG: PD-(D/E)XK nuclease family protein [Gammaproteobacteria bacterium]|nr:PD-(D/E)XK nuclease family protein [Gammaproteobacteria bacterium]